jgi:hypothetical protein
MCVYLCVCVCVCVFVREVCMSACVFASRVYAYARGVRARFVCASGGYNLLNFTQHTDTSTYCTLVKCVCLAAVCEEIGGFEPRRNG